VVPARGAAAVGSAAPARAASPAGSATPAASSLAPAQPAEVRLRSMVEALATHVEQAPPRRIGQSQAAAAERAQRFVAAHKGQPIRLPAVPAARAGVRLPPPAPRPSAEHPKAETELHPLGAAVGLALVVVLFLELYLGVAKYGLDGNRVLIAFGLALDACARALGTIAAGHEGSQGWAWACALGGSPLVAVFALYQESGQVRTEPAPLAGLIALIACGVLVVAGAATALGL
jgi:hypothetical protein